MTQGDTASREDFSLLRVVNFVLRYRRPILALPVLGFVLAAGVTMLQEERVYTAEATVRAPARDSARISYESLFRSAEVLSAVTGSDRSGGGGDLHPRSLRRRLEVSRSGDLVQLSLSVPSESLATRGLRRAIDTANAVYTERSLRTGELSALDTAKITEARDSLVELEDRIGSILQEYGWLELGVAFLGERPLTALAGLSKSADEAARSFEFVTLEPRMSRARTRLRKLLVRAARFGTMGEDRARTELWAARDSVREWLDRQGGDLLSASDRFRFQALLWRVELWEDVVEATEATGGSRPAPVVVAKPTVANVASSSPIQSGILGGLAGGLLAFVWGLVRESVRRGEELRSAAYREFRGLIASTRTLSWKGMRWLRGDSGEE